MEAFVLDCESIDSLDELEEPRLQLSTVPQANFKVV